MTQELKQYPRITNFMMIRPKERTLIKPAIN